MKIISGGQTGADQAGLAAAKELGIETGGWMPRNWVTEEGMRPDFLALYNMKEHPQKGYPPRTKQNVADSDGTIIFGNPDSPGCSLTIRACKKYNKPFLIELFPTNFPPVVSAAIIMKWLVENNINVLNIAGNRESTNPDIFKATKTILLLALKKD